MPTDRVYLISLIVFLAFLQGTVSAADLVGSFQSGSGDTFANFHYRAYHFFPTPGARFYIVMRSKTFDPYLMIIQPDGSVLTNDIHRISGVRQSGRDAGIAIEKPDEGRWTVVASTLRAATEGDYSLEYEGLPSLDIADLTSAGSEDIRAAFAARRISDPALRREALVEQLTLLSFRAELKRGLQQEIARLKKTNVESRERLGTLEEKQRELSKALVSVEKLADSRDFMRDLVGKDLKSTEAQIERLSGTLLKSVSESTALTIALGELSKLDAVANELREREDLFLRVPSTDAEDLSAAVVRLRSERDALARAIAEKLLDSRVVLDLRFGGFSVLDRQSSLSGTQGAGIELGLQLYSFPGAAIGAGVGALSGKVKPPIDSNVWLPALLPWPPPQASSRVVLNRRFLEKTDSQIKTLGNLDDRLQTALRGAGYSASSYWGVPGGFAIVTPLEQTNIDGIPLDGRTRWFPRIAEMKSFSLTEYLKALFTAPPGYFRVLVFVTSTEPFAPSGSRAKLETIERWSQTGLNLLPDPIRGEAFTKRHQITVLVYEFLKRRDADEPETSIPGRLAARDHLMATKLMSLLGGA